MKTWIKKWPIAISSVLFFAGVVIAGSVVSSVSRYEETRVTTAYRLAIAAVDTSDTVVPDIEVNNAPTLEVHGRSSAPGASITIRVKRYTKVGGVFTMRSSSTANLTAGTSGADQDAAGLYETTFTSYFDTGSAPVVRVFVTTKTGGETWDIWAQPVGPRQR